jgi:hypothetical protein
MAVTAIAAGGRGVARTTNRANPSRIQNARVRRYERRRRTGDISERFNERYQEDSVSTSRRIREQRRSENRQRSARARTLAAPGRLIGPQNVSGFRQRLRKTRTVANTIKQKARALSASVPLLLPALTAHAFIFFFALWHWFGMGAGMLGEAVFSWIPIFGDTFANYASTPGKAIWGVGMLMTSIFGGLTLAAILFTYLIRGVRWYTDGVILFTLVAAFTLYLTPLSFAPWFLLFMLVVILRVR